MPQIGSQRPLSNLRSHFAGFPHGQKWKPVGSLTFFEHFIPAPCLN